MVEWLNKGLMSVPSKPSANIPWGELNSPVVEWLNKGLIAALSPNYSVRQAVLQELAAEHQVPAILLQHRSLSKLKGTYTDPLPALVRYP